MTNDRESNRGILPDLLGTLEYAHHVGSPQIIPTNEGMIKSRSSKIMHEQAQIQIDLIWEQMKNLAKQAQKIKSKVEFSREIYEAKINFEPVVGNDYYLYKKLDGHKFISMIDPKELNQNKLQQFGKHLAKLKFMADYTWHVIELFDSKDS